MSNMPATDKRKISLYLKIRTIAKIDHLAKENKCSRNEQVQMYLDKMTKRVELTDEELAEVRAEEDANRKARKSGTKPSAKKAAK